MIAKIHKTLEGRTILAVCDSELIGKRFEENDFQIDLSSDFYKGEEMDDKRIIEMFKVVHIVNLVGKKSVELGLKEGVINKEFVLLVEGVPHAQGIITKE